jgi:hypothetical protein
MTIKLSPIIIFQALITRLQQLRLHKFATRYIPLFRYTQIFIASGLKAFIYVIYQVHEIH